MSVLRIKKDSEGIKIEGHRGKWYVISDTIINGTKMFLLEHETYGEDAPALIVDTNGNILLDDVCNGFDDYYEYVSQ